MLAKLKNLPPQQYKQHALDDKMCTIRYVAQRHPASIFLIAGLESIEVLYAVCYGIRGEYQHEIPAFTRGDGKSYGQEGYPEGNGQKHKLVKESKQLAGHSAHEINTFFNHGFSTFL